MKRFLVISALIALPYLAFAQGNSGDAPGKEKGSGQSAKQFSRDRKRVLENLRSSMPPALKIKIK